VDETMHPPTQPLKDRAFRVRPDALLRAVFVALIVATAFAVAGKLSSGMSNGMVAGVDPRCAHFDSVAATRLATLIFDHDELAQMQVRQGLVRLRRARRSCQYEGFEVARRDYEAIAAFKDARP
jgi:hypothetical protein